MKKINFRHSGIALARPHQLEDVFFFSIRNKDFSIVFHASIITHGCCNDLKSNLLLIGSAFGLSHKFSLPKDEIIEKRNESYCIWGILWLLCINRGGSTQHN